MNGVSGVNAVAFKFDGGVIAAIDTAASYGRIAISNMQRVFQATDDCVLVFTGLLSDIQFLERFIKQELESEERKMDSQGIHKMVQRIMYSKRSEAKPFAVSVIVCGVNPKHNKVFESTDEKGRMLGVVNSKGNFWFDDCVALGFSSNFALPMLREKNLANLKRSEAIILMEEVFRILCYKDCRASNTIQMAIVQSEGVEIFDPHSITTDWTVGIKDGEILIN